MDEKTVKSKSVFKGKVLNVRVDRVVLSNGREATREIVEHPGAVAILPVLPDGKIVLVKQFRKPVEEVLLEIPAGKLEKGESPEPCARRELEEETGYRAGKIRKILEYLPSPGYSNELIHVYEATDLKRGKKNLQSDELMETVAKAPSEIEKLIKRGRIKDSKTIIGVLAIKRQSRPYFIS